MREARALRNGQKASEGVGSNPKGSEGIRRHLPCAHLLVNPLLGVHAISRLLLLPLTPLARRRLVAAQRMAAAPRRRRRRRTIQARRSSVVRRLPQMRGLAAALAAHETPFAHALRAPRLVRFRPLDVPEERSIRRVLRCGARHASARDARARVFCGMRGEGYADGRRGTHLANATAASRAVAK